MYSFISTWPSAVTLMNGSCNWTIVFTWRDKPHKLWTQTSSLVRGAPPLLRVPRSACRYSHTYTNTLPSPTTPVAFLIRIHVRKRGLFAWLSSPWVHECFMPGGYYGVDSGSSGECWGRNLGARVHSALWGLCCRCPAFGQPRELVIHRRTALNSEAHLVKFDKCFLSKLLKEVVPVLKLLFHHVGHRHT